MKKIIAKIKSLNTNLLVAGSALFISACALFLSLQEVRIMRTQQKASMYPYLTIGGTYNNEGFGIELKNSGNGLAKINSYKIFNDSIYFKDWFDILKTYMPESTIINYSNVSTSGNIRNQMIAPGETKQLIFIEWNRDSRILEPKLENLKITICYESLLGENWFINDGIPTQINNDCKILVAEEFGF